MRNPGEVNLPPVSFPQVVAHRGASARIAEHTLAAYQAAIDAGAEALECDVRLTADGHLVCVHDSRIDRTSDGRGRVSNKTLTELQSHDFGSWHEMRPGTSAEDLRLMGVLTLDQLLEQALAAPRRIEVAIETKHPTRFGGYTEQVLVQTLERYGLVPASRAESQVRVMSFSSLAMRRMRDLNPRIPAVYLIEQPPRLLRTGVLPAGATIAGPCIAILRDDPDAVRRYQQAGAALHVWTADTRADLELCMRMGVAAVITNHPGEILAWRSELWEHLVRATDI